MKGNGWMGKGAGKENKFGRMDPPMRESSSKTKPTDRASLCTVTAISMKDTGLKT